MTPDAAQPTFHFEFDDRELRAALTSERVDDLPGDRLVRPLDPLLLLAGLVAGVAVLCLLLVGSRTSRAREEEA